MQDLCAKTYKQTKEFHKQVDKHEIVKKIDKAENTKCYIDLIVGVLFLLEMKIKNDPEKCDVEIYQLIKRNPNVNKVDFTDINKKIMNDFDNEIHFKSQIYLWYLSLMAGGKLLKKVLPNEYNYLFDFQAGLKEKLKNFINEIPEDKHDEFIENVKVMYKLIKKHFDMNVCHI
jgi:hypothetical protein